MLQIFPRLPGKKFKDPPLEEEILSFIRDLGHTGEIKVLTDVNVNHKHQPWRSFAAIINRCLSGKNTGLDSLRMLRAQIIWGMYHKKNVDYVYLLWEYLDQSISRRNKMFWHTARDDPMFNTIRVISRHQDTQIYGDILPNELTNQEMLDSKAYKEYYIVASGAEPLKAKTKYKKKADKPVTPSKSKTTPASKGLAVLSEVALTEAEQIKMATKRSKTQFYNSHASGSGDGVDTQSKVLDEQQQKDSGTDEGVSDKPEVPDVHKYDSESDEESWTFSQDEEDANEETDVNDDSDETESDNDRDDLTHPNLSTYKADDE
ncbi:hypothetical protein Tco_0349306 [Tanacetum coccineum]